MKNTVKSTFVREFTIEKQAEKFAKEKQGKIQVIYGWDDMKGKLIKTYLVKY